MPALALTHAPTMLALLLGTLATAGLLWGYAWLVGQGQHSRRRGRK